ncbi:MAG: Gfo/Idh/MocA family oxidoreductase [Anaerolineae bacterium]|nr:Gfo/Idh/MocA family oxidoreductase [Anaerolineae bacterium]
MSLNLAIVGAGRMTQIAHIPSLLQIRGVEIAALADIETALAERVAARYNIPRVYRDSLELLAGEDKLDGVLVVTPRMFHADACLPVLERGIPVFLEKPLEVSLDKGRAIVEAQVRSGAVMVIGYHNRYDPAFVMAHKMLGANELGALRYGVIHSFGGAWMAGAEALGGISPDETRAATAPPQAQARDAKKFPAEVEWVEGWIHEINMARSLFGEAKQVIFATNEMPRLALVEFEKARGLFEVGLMNPPGSVFDCTIALHCDQGRIDLDFAPPLAFRQRSQIKITTPASVSYPSLTYQESFVQELVHFLQCIRGLAAPHTTVQDAQRDLELAFEIIRHL